MNMKTFWCIAPCSIVGVYRRFRGAYCFYHQGDEITVKYRLYYSERDKGKKVSKDKEGEKELKQRQILI
jgi:hypothetical protein